MAFDPVLNLAGLDGSNGFRIDGVARENRSGFSVSNAGDINSDGFDDLILGTPYADPNDNADSGPSYVVFGRGSRFSSTLNLSRLNGSNGFRIDGVAARDYSSYSVSSAGDINGDGVDDLILGADGVATNGRDSGSSYVMFGREGGFSSTLNPSSLNGSNGFRIDGVAEGDLSGFSVSSAGDINSDGIDDLIIGAIGADPNGSDSGASYVVFGRRANQAPTIVTNSVVNMPENTTLVVDIQATDDSSSEGNGLTYSLSGGNDQALFTIDATTGVLSFLTAPDFENPMDVGNDNGYAVEVTVTNAGGLSTAQLFNINLNDVNDNSTPFDDILSGTAGNDTIRALTGNDVVRGLGGDDRIFGQVGNDILIGGTGNDVLNGGADNDRIFGQAGSDRLDGGNGDDRIDGGSGNDIITTGQGRDLLVIRQNDGLDRVTDFQNNQDRIDLVGIRFGQLTIQQRQDDVLIKLGTTNLLLLENTNASAIDRADFV
ncbi:MAG TPA: cadherin domain-containing protein [Candidatus Obscuribacterales bacterium]